MTLLSLFFAIFPIVSNFPPPTSLSDPAVQQGTNRYGAQTIESLESTGLIKLEGTTITQSLAVTGSLIANNAQLRHLTVIGEANLRDTKVTDEATFIGYLQAHKTTFDHPITLNSQKAVFTASTLKGITFKRDGSYKGRQFLELKQGTIIEGPVTFEGGKGEIYLYSGSKILGPISGGKKIYK